jgi:hypothetical protein
MPLRSYSGNAKTTTLAAAITNVATTFSVADGTGYPTGVDGPFVVTLSGGTAGEEKVLCSARTGNDFTVATGGRGWDGTTAAAHSSLAAVQHTFSATDAREANAHVNGTAAVHTAAAVTFTPAGAIASTNVQAAIEEVVTDANVAYLAKALADAKGDLIVATAADVFARLTVGTNGQALLADSAQPAGVRWGAAGLDPAGVQAARIDAAESTTSTALTDLTTIGPAVTATIGASGRALVIIGARVRNSVAGNVSGMAPAVSGATTRAAVGGVEAVVTTLTTDIRASSAFVMTGLTAGSNTFTAKYVVSAGTGTWSFRDIAVIPL